MKFAHEYKAALVREGFPTTWVDSAISYSQLKKALKKVSQELQEIGLDPATLSQFDPNPNRAIQQGSRESGDSAVAYRYEFEGDRKEFRPKLTLFLGDELSVNATLSPDTRAFLERLAAKQGDSSLHEDVSDQQETGDDDCRSSARKTSTESASAVRRVDIPLTSDAEFFDLLKGNVTNLDSLQVLEQESMTDEIVELSTDLTSLAQPRSRFYKKTDMYRWRELFDIYLQAQVFFSTRESDSGSRNSTQAAIQLNWFQSEVKRRGLVELFKLPASHQALDRFVRINIELLLNLKYQELQRTAIGKITKKFQKRTKLAAMKTFPKVIERDMIMSETMTKAVCAQVGNELIKLVPQLDDFRCPICDDIAFRPIRMRCQHIFCILCVVKLQRSNKGRCPICRDSVIMLADTDNIDRDLQTFLKRHFPKETLQKMIDIETFYGKEQFGEQYRHPSEQNCSIM